MTFIKYVGAFAAITYLTMPAMAQIAESKVDHSKMDHSKMDHSDMSSSDVKPQKMQHSDMEHGDMDHANMDHSKHEMSSMGDGETVMGVNSAALVVSAKVNGLVCDFCAQALRKVFKKEEAVDDISVDLDAGVVNIMLKDGGEIEDDRIKKLIRKSGYSLVSIERQNVE